MALANFLVGKRDAAGAEREFKAAAGLAPVGSAARLRLADFYLLLRRPEEARKTLVEITEKAPDFLPASRRLAEIAFAEQKRDEAVKALDGHLLRGRVHLAKRETTEAIQEFQMVLKAEPRLAPVRHQLALAHLQAGSPRQATTELKEAVTLAPNFADAVLLLADLNIKSGAAQPAIEDLDRFLGRQPNAAPALVLPMIFAHGTSGARALMDSGSARATSPTIWRWWTIQLWTSSSASNVCRPRAA